MQLFYTPAIQGDISTLNETESGHAIRVLRLSEGSTIRLVDGKGHLMKAEITRAHPKKCEIRIIHTDPNYGKSSHYLHIAIAPTKNSDRLEWFVEKATEIGINEITPILCAHSERKVIKPERLEKVLITAMKQSLKAYLPLLNPLTSLEKLLPRVQQEGKFIAHCYAGEKKPLKELISSSSSNLILIGPEGDFSEEEVELALRQNFRPVSLGESRLRTETAGIVACHTVNLIKNV